MGHDILRCSFCNSDVMEGHNDWDCDCGAVCSSKTNFKWIKNIDYPICPKCKSNSQVWKNQINGKLMCHRVGCYIEIKS